MWNGSLLNFLFPCSWVWNESSQKKWKRCFLYQWFTTDTIYPVQWLWRWRKIREADLGEVFGACAEHKGLTLPVFAALDPPLSLKNSNRVTAPHLDLTLGQRLRRSTAPESASAAPPLDFNGFWTLGSSRLLCKAQLWFLCLLSAWTNTV